MLLILTAIFISMLLRLANKFFILISKETIFLQLIIHSMEILSALREKTIQLEFMTNNRKRSLHNSNLSNGILKGIITDFFLSNSKKTNLTLLSVEGGIRMYLSSYLGVNMGFKNLISSIFYLWAQNCRRFIRYKR